MPDEKGINLDSLLAPLLEIVRGFSAYWRSVKRFTTTPTFPAAMNDKDALKKGLQFFAYSVVISFIMLIPAFVAHGETISKLFYVGLSSLYLLLTAIPKHFALKIVGARNVRFNRTLAMNAYIAGFFNPLFNLLNYPLLWLFGVWMFFGDAPRAQRAMNFVFNDYPWLKIYLIFSFIGVTIYSFVIHIVLLSKSHQISKLRVFIALSISLVLLFPFDRFMLTPAWLTILRTGDKAINYLL